MIRLLSVYLVSAFLVACGASPDSSQSLQLEGTERFPQHPHTDMTPGEACSNPDTYRYPEHIAYCERDVSTSTKQAIIREYDRRFGYSIGQMNRQDFKIDHFFPLCMGGSNGTANLWPQHKSVYTLTDPLEQRLCELMAQGRLTQREAMDKIRHAKFNLDDATRMFSELEAMGR